MSSSLPAPPRGVRLSATFSAARASLLEGFGAARDPEIAACTVEARRRVQLLLALPERERQVELSASLLATAAARAFDGARPGYVGALPLP